MRASSWPTADHAPAALPPCGKRALRSAVAALLIYGNAVALLQAPALRAAGLTVPAPMWLRDAFLLHGMFTSFSRYNSELFLVGLRTDRGVIGDRGRWVPLRLRDHFAARYGVMFTQLFAMHHWDVHGPSAQRRAWAALAARIRARHNRMQPERPISAVRFGSLEWPQDPRGYRARKAEARPRIWYDESAAPPGKRAAP